MRRGVVVVIVLAAVMVLSAIPVMADRRKSTITLELGSQRGCDSDRHHAERREQYPGASGGAGAPCTYVPASVGLDELYSQQGRESSRSTAVPIPMCACCVPARMASRCSPAQRSIPSSWPCRPATACRCRRGRSRQTQPVARLAFRPCSGTRAMTAAPSPAPSAPSEVAGRGGGDPDQLPLGLRGRRVVDQRGAGACLSGPVPDQPHLPDSPPGECALPVRLAVRWRTGGGPWAPLPPLARTASATLAVAESQTVIAQ